MGEIKPDLKVPVIWGGYHYSQDKKVFLAQTLNIPLFLAACFCSLGILDPEEAKKFLAPKLADLENPFKINNLEKLVIRLVKAIERGEKIAISGDYDVDGITSTGLMVRILQDFGLNPTYYIPLRDKEGYGLSKEIIERVLQDQTPDIFLALDCGTNADDAIQYLKNKGIEVLVIDHHQHQGEQLPDCLVVNPHVWDGDDRPWSHLCAVGLVFKVAHGLLKKMRQEEDPRAYKIKLSTYLDLVCLGTVADMMPLRDENRILVYHGLRWLSKTQNRGIRALHDIAEVNLESPINPNEISFKMAPRINACGRLGDASIPLELILSESDKTCQQLAKKMDETNRERQQIEQKLITQAENQVEDHFRDDLGLILYHRDWHKGVVGIAAGKLCRQYNRPCIVLGHEENGILKGSGRSLNGISLIKTLGKCESLLDSWGGHPMAAGVSILEKNLPALRLAFNQILREIGENEIRTREIKITDWIQIDDLNPSMLETLSTLEPFGQNHPQPIFGIRNIELPQPAVIMGKQSEHCRFTLKNNLGEVFQTVGWNMANRLPPYKKLIDIAIRLHWNFWRGDRTLQIELIEWRPATS